MAILKHIAIKNTHYDAALDYLTMQHDEFTMKPVLGVDGRQLPREEYLIDGINCNPYTFAMECEAVNAAFHKNQTKAEVKAHHYIISFDPRDRDENGLTLESAQSFAMEFAKKNFPGHQAVVCTHPDGHNSAGNIHVHIVINSVRAFDVEMQDFMERPCDAKAGYKHHVTDKLLAYLKQETMIMCQENSLYQVDLLNPAKVRITDREYWAKKRGQAKLDKENTEKSTKGEPVTETKYETDKAFLRRVISDTIADSDGYEDFCKRLFERYGISVHESRGRFRYLLPDRNRPICGRQLGTDYEKESIKKAFLQKSIPVGSDIRFVTDLENNIKARQNAYYRQKAKVGNLQQMAKALAFVQDNGIQSLEELEMLDAAVSDDFTKINASLKATEARLRKTNLMIKNAGQYLANKDVYRQYLNARNKAAFRESHHTELALYEAARKFLKEESSGDKLPTMKMLKEEKSKLTALKNRQYEEYSTMKATINRILCIYIPYARYYGYFRIFYEYEPLLPNFDNSYFYELDSSELLSSIDNSFAEAVNHLYEKCRYDFIDIYMDFVTNHDSFKRWTYRFAEWIEDALMPLLKQYMPEEYSFSARILNMIEADFSKIPLLKITNDPDELEVIKSLLNSTDKYIDSLEEIYRNHPYIDFNN